MLISSRTLEEGLLRLSLGEARPSDKPEPDFHAAQCLFCPCISADFDDNLEHMLQRHGLFIPHRKHLVVDEMALIKYCHLIVFGYLECLFCGSERRNLQATQQHMVDKGHCRINVDCEDSEFRDFYDFDSNQESDSGTASGVEDDGGDPQTVTRLVVIRKATPVLVDDHSLRLGSGKVLSHRSQQAKIRSQKHRERVSKALDLIPGAVPPDAATDTEQPDARQSKRLAKMTTKFDHHLTTLRAQDRRSIMHLPAYQQRAVVAKSKRQVEYARKAENEMLLKIQLQANKTLKK